MKVEISQVRKCLKAFDFATLFREQLGWDKHNGKLEIPIDGSTYSLSGVAQKRGFAAFTCDFIPDRATRLKIDNQVTKSAREHFVIYTDRAAGQQVWQWVRREPGKPMASRDHRFDTSQSGDHLIQRLEQIAIGMQEEEGLTLFDVTGRTRAAFDVDKVTKKFYDRFKKEHAAFLKFIKGIKDKADRQWYTSLMLNRLMFVYFIQKKGFLDGDTNYLQNRMQLVRDIKGKDKFQNFYRYFLVRLFHDGLGKHENERKLDKTLEKLLGNVPYLNGGFFEVHQLEERNTDINIPDKAFEKLFAFFDEFKWHLDERPLRDDKEINPDVVGYIFEKYINQKQMGAYYTKEDITEYISKNTIIPFLFDAAEKKCPIAFRVSPSPSGGEGRGEGLPFLWRMLRDNPDRYVYAAVRHGVIDSRTASSDPTVNNDRTDPSHKNDRTDPTNPSDDILPLPKHIAAGINNVAKRADWNKAADDPFALPTETWREHVARRTRCLELREKLAAGEVHNINDLITLNLDIWQFARDAIVNCEGPELLRAFWQAIQNVTVLDPTCGSGAFLFAALQILESLYSDCLERMQRFVEDQDRGIPIPDDGDANMQVREKFIGNTSPTRQQVSSNATNRKNLPKKFHDFRKILADMAGHASERYFVLKSIIINNLFGVDIMEEAVEICKLRLFLKLVAQVERVDQIEPLPDIDFNIRAGNTLVGYVSLDQVRDSQKGTLGFAADDVKRIEEDALAVDKAFQQFRAQQTQHGGKVTATDKLELRIRLAKLDNELDRYLAGEYGINIDKEKDFDKWRSSHEPFHWFVEFHGIMRRCGFDVSVGNPPYVNVSNVRKVYNVRDYTTGTCPDIYSWCLERVSSILQPNGRSGMIVPLSLSFSGDFCQLRQLLFERYGGSWFSSFGRIPSALFNHDVRVRNTIHLGAKSPKQECNYSTELLRWFDEARPQLFELLTFAKFNPKLWGNRIPKLNSNRLGAAFEGLFAQSTVCVRDQTVRQGSERVLYFKKTAYNWLAFSKMPPPCEDANGRQIPQSQLDSLVIANKQKLEALHLLLNGKLMFVFWCVLGDDFHVTKGIIQEFPLSPEFVSKIKTSDIKLLSRQLDKAMTDALQYKRNAGMNVGNFNLAMCRHVTDRSDLIMREALGLNDIADDVELYCSRVVRTAFE